MPAVKLLAFLLVYRRR